MTTRPAAPAGLAGLHRNCLSALENVGQSIGTMGPVATIGTVLPLLIYKSANGSWLLLLGVLVAFGAVAASINVFASRFASAGSLSAYARAGLGETAGRLAGWSYLVAMTFVVTSSGVSSAYYVALAYTRLTGAALGPLGLVLITFLVVFLAWWPAHRDIRISTTTMLAAEAFSVLLILTIIVAAMVRSHHLIDRDQVELRGFGLAPLRLGFVLAFMTLAGFESTSALGEEARTATHTLPRVMLYCIVPTGILFVASVYCLTALSHTLNLSLDQTDAPLDMIARSVGLPTLGWLSSLGVAISCFGCALGGFNAGSRVLYAMARERQLWPYFEAIHPINGTPHRALALFAAIALLVPVAMIGCGITMANAMDYLMQIASFGFLGGYLLVCIAAPVFLAKAGPLSVARVALAVGSVSILGAAFLFSLVPVPDAPWRYLPYLFAGLLAAGMAVSRHTARPPAPPSEAVAGPGTPAQT